MATKKDLVEAHAFSRRRLVTAFLSGAPGGREVEPSRPGRTIVGGLALALLVVATGAILAALVGRTQEGWQYQAGVVVATKPNGLFVVLKGSKDGGDIDLRPLLNPVSGQLIFGDADQTVVSHDTIDDYDKGPTIGIDNAPQSVPTRGDLVETGWTACTDGPHVSAEISTGTHVDPVSGQAFLVKDAAGVRYLIARSGLTPTERDPQAYSYRLGADAATVDPVIAAIGLDITAADAVEVSDDWLGLFPPFGEPLTGRTFVIADRGARVQGAGTRNIPGDATYGDYVVVDGDTYVFSAPGQVAKLDPFAAAVYLNSPPPGAPRPQLRQGDDLAPQLQADTSLFRDNHWPTTTLAAATPGPMCAVLVTDADGSDADGPARVEMGQAPRDDAAPLEDGPALRRTVEPGHGAFVYVGGFEDTTSSSPIVIDDRATAYPIEGSDSLANLGYDIAAPVVPKPWAALFDQEREKPVVLSRSAALCTPDARTGDTCVEPDGGQ